MEKYIPTVGEHLFLSQRTGRYYVDLVKYPYTVIAVTPNVVTIRACKLIFSGPRYYDTVADKIEDDESGEVMKLHYSKKKSKWQVDRYHTGYPEYAFFGEWRHHPYLY